MLALPLPASPRLLSLLLWLLLPLPLLLLLWLLLLLLPLLLWLRLSLLRLLRSQRRRACCRVGQRHSEVEVDVHEWQSQTAERCEDRNNVAGVAVTVALTHATAVHGRAAAERPMSRPRVAARAAKPEQRWVAVAMRIHIHTSAVCEIA